MEPDMTLSQISPAALRKRSLTFFGLALLAAFVVFYMLFVGHVDHFLAVGVSALAFLVFVLLFNRAWSLWELSREVPLHG
jgi:hypothetical protein